MAGIMFIERRVSSFLLLRRRASRRSLGWFRQGGPSLYRMRITGLCLLQHLQSGGCDLRTWILGSAELLLARRGRLSPAETQRIRAIVQLAVSLREAERRLSSSWEETADSKSRVLDSNRSSTSARV